MHWKSILETRENLERGVTIQIQGCLAAMRTASGFSALYQFSQETPRQEKTNAGHGKMYQMILFQKEAKNYIELVVNLTTCK